MSTSAYADALKLLARRELSEAQVRQRLARHGHDHSDIDDAVSRLKAERALDDARVAEAIARTETAVKRRGKLRVKRQIESAGIEQSTASRTVDEVFDSIDSEELIASALKKRLREGAPIRDDRELQRLYRYLVGQGFEPEQVLKTLRRRQAQPD